MSSSSKPNLSYASVVRGSSSDSQDDGDFSPSWLHRFQRCSETEALNIALEESVKVSINVNLLINTANRISHQRFQYCCRCFFLLFCCFSVRHRKKPLVISTLQAMTIQTTTADGRSKRYAYFISVCYKFKFHPFNFAFQITDLILYNIPLSLS